MRIEDGTGAVFGQYPAGLGQAASLIRQYTFSPDSPDLTVFRDSSRLRTPIPALMLPAGFKVRCLDNGNIDSVGDNLLIRALVQRRLNQEAL